MKRAMTLLLLSLSLRAAAGTFSNPIIPGFHPDPSICRAGDDYYLVNSSFEYFPGLPIYHSRDLTHWELIANALDRPSQLPLKGANDASGLFAPTIRYWKGLFYLVCDNTNNGGSFIVTARNPKGPWSEPLWLKDYPMDASLFFDDNGKVYFTRFAGSEKGGISQAELDIRTGKMGSMRLIWNDTSLPWNEGPHLYKINGWYYLMLAEGGTFKDHREMIGRSKSPWGPFEPSPLNPVITESDEPANPIQNAGHGDMVQIQDGSWWMVFLGIRPQNGVSVLGRETFLAPITWKDGWPVAGEAHHARLTMPAPKLPVFHAAQPLTHTSFAIAALGPEWVHVRNADPADFSLSARPGYLRIRSSGASLNRRDDAPAFVGRRQASFSEVIRTRMDFPPSRDGAEAGICVRANDSNHNEVGVARVNGNLQVFARSHIKDQDKPLASVPVKSGSLQLEIAASPQTYRFSYSLDGQNWIKLAEAPAADLSRENAGGFTGTVVGLYASSAQGTGDAADFAWFEAVP
jgi:alpha-N-arabinofuranosidase